MWQELLRAMEAEIAGPEDEFDEEVNGLPDSTLGDDDESGFDEMAGWPDEELDEDGFDDAGDDEEDTDTGEDEGEDLGDDGDDGEDDG